MKTWGRITITFIALAAGILPGIGEVHAQDPKWEAAVPTVGNDPVLWAKTVGDLRADGLDYGAMAAANHMIALFPDISSKESAYKTIIAVINDGYPALVRNIFIPGDLEPDPSISPEDYEFANSYYLYKAILSEDRDTRQWADYYFSKIDKKNFPPYLFYEAVESYSKGDLPAAEKSIKQALSLDVQSQPRAFVIKMMRTLARIYFEEKEYDKSLDIYSSFLLKLNPIFPSDWLEAAWDEFYLKKYGKSLGYLYNLESKAASRKLDLEKFNLRALIYRATCSISNMEELINSFNAVFKPVLDGIKKGESLDYYPVLKKLELPENADYNDTRKILLGLDQEYPQVDDLPDREAALAHYVYRSEIILLKQRLKALTPDALNRAASRILSISEQMRFLRFDIERSKYDPARVFQPVSVDKQQKAVSAGALKGSFEIRWLQFGDFWLDERGNYRGMITNQCSE